MLPASLCRKRQQLQNVFTLKQKIPCFNIVQEAANEKAAALNCKERKKENLNKFQSR